MIQKKKITFLFTHPIQYFSPLLKLLSEDNTFDIEVLYCEDTSQGYYDKEFGKIVQWDTPLLKGFKYSFLPNSILSNLGSFFKYSNFRIISKLKINKPDILIIHGWNYFTAILAIIVAKFLGIKVWHRGESPYKQEVLKPKWVLVIKRIYFKYFLFKLFDKFLYIGKQNKLFYQYYGIKENALVFTPYCINNSFFQSIKQNLSSKTDLRQQLHIDSSLKIIISVGKLIPKKNPFVLLEAFKLLDRKDTLLMFVGDGLLRTDMENYIADNKLRNVLITGFKNQTELPIYYSVADIFVLPSIAGETWGLVVNEAMNFELPIITSSIVGCADDLVQEGINGFTFDLGDNEKLCKALKMLLDDESLRKKMGKASFDIVQNYSYQSIIQNLKNEMA